MALHRVIICDDGAINTKYFPGRALPPYESRQQEHGSMPVSGPETGLPNPAERKPGR